LRAEGHDDEKQETTPRLKHRDIFEQRDHAEDDYDDAHDLFGAPVDRQQVDQIENQNNDEKRNEYAYEHLKFPCYPVTDKSCLTHQELAGSLQEPARPDAFFVTGQGWEPARFASMKGKSRIAGTIARPCTGSLETPGYSDATTGARR
jgi:hypothetical protein